MVGRELRGLEAAAKLSPARRRETALGSFIFEDRIVVEGYCMESKANSNRNERRGIQLKTKSRRKKLDIQGA